MIESIARRTGLTKAEIDLAIRCLNGVVLMLPAVPERGLSGAVFGRDKLLQEIRGEASNAHEDIAGRGTWLETADGNPEAPFLINDLVERIETLSDAQAEILLYFIEGYYYGAQSELAENN